MSSIIRGRGGLSRSRDPATTGGIGASVRETTAPLAHRPLGAPRPAATLGARQPEPIPMTRILPWSLWGLAAFLSVGVAGYAWYFAPHVQDLSPEVFGNLFAR